MPNSEALNLAKHTHTHPHTHTHAQWMTGQRSFPLQSVTGLSTRHADSIQGFSEPSHTLIDLTCPMYIENVCFHIDWHKCAVREQEVMQDKKVHSLLTLASTANLRPAPQDKSRADVSAHLHAYVALRRSGLALDQAN
eukprot:2639565-Amphidinium_carterae.1